ncbi:TetR/AcrR family transcriptional regulator C-terminal domain-containing protein [Amycolatopsis jiangsuensis]|uniref:AcrR family transcriptional regulator n=1 Tax=Amycolatopsis jiangsuensis TaxID=1181879 RepID=A0A840IM45_9PSEU|nr:TetR/AcrR family transcriptional regulator C-terminal domain-containing protein [Amycolatopsis jiangsuensis]MBB4682545.1 AcrR family transcriptional regulator [Amycolatopsis jiangsuensis]
MTTSPAPRRRAPVPRRRAEKPLLSQELVVHTAQEILAAEGIRAVSMRRVAQRLQTGPASLYAYVSGKEELDELLLDAALGEIPSPEPDPHRWDAQLKEQVRLQITAMTAYPGIAMVAWNTPVPGTPHALRQGETMLALLRAGGLDLKQAAFAADALSTYAKAFACEASSWASGEYDAEQVAERGRQMTGGSQSGPAEAFAHLGQIGEFFTADTSEERLEFALETFVAGLRALVRA